MKKLTLIFSLILILIPIRVEVQAQTGRDHDSTEWGYWKAVE